MPRAPHPFLRRLGTRIRELRAQRGYSQEAFADRVGLDRSYMSGIERGVRNLSVLTLARIARGLGVPVSSLFDKEP